MTARESRTEFRLELMTGVLLGLAAISTAWAAFQASIWDGDELEGYAVATLKVSEAGALISQADRTALEDELLFIEWAVATAQGEDNLAEFIREDLMSRRLQNALEAVETGRTADRESLLDPDGPNYQLPALERGREALADANVAMDRAHEAGGQGDQFNLITVLVAASLFVVGISSTFDVTRIRAWTLIVGAGLLAFAAVWMAMLPTRLS